MSKKFRVEDKERFMPIRRIEKPVYKENKDGSIEILKQDIIFVGALIQ